MKAKELLAALDLPLQLAARKISTMEILGHIKLAEGKAAAYNFAAACEITLHGTDLGCCVPAGRFSNALSAIASLGKEAEVKLVVKGKQLLVTAPGVRYALPTMPVAEFPAPVWPTEPKPIADWSALTSALTFAVHACNAADHRHFCKGVAATKAGYIGGTDGHRGAIAEGESPFGKLDFIVPLEAIPTIAKLPAATSYAVSDTAVALEFPDGRFFVQLVAGGYVDLARVVPIKHPQPAVASVKREAFASATAAMLKTRLKDFIRLKGEKNKLVMEDEANHQGGASIEVDCVYDGEPWETGINVRYVAEAADVLDGEHLTLSFGNQLLLLKGSKESRSVGVMAARV